MRKNINRKALFIWLAAILGLILLLMVAILRLEPEKPGIPRAQAAKAAALFAASRQECIQYQEESGGSRFQEKEQKNWYVPYMDYLYGHGGLDEEMLPASAELAQKELTYQEAYRLAGFLGKSYGEQVKLNRANRNKAFPAEYWCQI